MVGDGGRQDMGRQWEKEREREGKKGGFMRHRDTQSETLMDFTGKQTPHNKTKEEVVNTSKKKRATPTTMQLFCCNYNVLDLAVTDTQIISQGLNTFSSLMLRNG